MTQQAYWQYPNGSESAYTVDFTPTGPGTVGFAAYRAAMHTIREISETLSDEGAKLRYRAAPEGAGGTL